MTHGQELPGKCVAISGAAGGIGCATARRFHKSGASLILIDRNIGALEALQREFDPLPRIVQCEQRDEASIGQAVEAASEADIFINNAGIIARKPLFDMSTEEIKDIIAVNATGSIMMAIGIARAMAGRGGGVIVNLSSQHAFIGAKHRAIYAATKAAMSQFTRSAALEWAPLGIRVVALAPGPVVSPMTADAMESEDYRRATLERMPIGRFLEADEMAELIHQLCSPAMSAFVGQTLIADGGSSLT